MKTLAPPNKEDVELFQQLINENRYDFCKLVYIIFPFGQKGHELEHMQPYPWQMQELKKLSKHLQDPKTRYQTYRLIVSSGNGAAKTALGVMIYFCLMYTQQLRARITANTDPQMKSVVWPEYDIWFRRARYHEYFFEKFGTSIKAKNPELADTWRLDAVTWSEQAPAAMSGLHNYGKAVLYILEEGPGIPGIIFKYSMGAFTEKNTIKIFLSFGNSDDPESYFEQCMVSPLWNSLRIDTRTLEHIDKKQTDDWLLEAGGDEDNDDFRVRVRGLPRKTSKDSIIRLENVNAALERRHDFDIKSVEMLPVILTCDPAWTGGDDTTIWYRQGNYKKLLEKYKLDKLEGDTHMVTYKRLCHWEKLLGADAVFIDQGEGTGIYTLAMNEQKIHWVLIAFAGKPTDNVDHKESEYHNIRAQMYYLENIWLLKGGVLDSEKEEWIPDIRKQFCWTKGTRHRITGKKLAESKKDIKDRVLQSPDVVDGAVLSNAFEITERLPENDNFSEGDSSKIGGQAFKMPDHKDVYEEYDDGLYD